jgi:hypothetical protein
MRNRRRSVLAALGLLASLMLPATPGVAAARSVVTGDGHVGGYLHCLPRADPGARAVGSAVVWLRDGRPVPGADVPTFPLVDADLGHSIGCALGSDAASSPIVVAGIPPAFHGGPDVEYLNDDYMWCSSGSITGDPSPTVTYEWLVNQVPVGDPGPQFTPLPSTPRDSVACRVTLTNAAGSVSATSTSIHPIRVVTSLRAARVTRADVPPRVFDHSFFVTSWRRVDSRGRLRFKVACDSRTGSPCRIRIVVREAHAGPSAPPLVLGHVVVPANKTTLVALPVRPARLRSLRSRFALAADLTSSLDSGEPPTETARLLIDASPWAGLGWAHQVRGFVSRPTFADAPRLARSVVVILARTRGTDDAWSPICTGTKVMTGTVGYPLILTAAHCFNALLQSVYGADAAPPPAGSSIDDYVGMGDSEYAIADASAPLHARALAPVAIVDGITIHRQLSADIAFVHARPEYPDVPVAGRRYDEIPALAYQPASTPPSIGAPAIADSAPDLSRRQTRADGVYVGRRSDGFRVFDAVVIAPDGMDDDPCYYGGSGSLALTGGGTLLGPLSQRAANGYANGDRVWIDSIAYKALWSGLLAKALDVEPGVFALDTVCLYTTPRASQIAATSSAFGRYP